jgi:SAM-dependent methyltransferase
MGIRSAQELIDAALAAPFEGWDFSWVGDRATVDRYGWDYRQLVLEAAAGARTMVDMGTGGGEFVAELPARPPCTWATEAWRPNVGVAARRLQPLGIGVVEVEGAPDNDRYAGAGGQLPFRSDSIDLLINRHEAYSPNEVARVLAPGGRFITQQVGGSNDLDMFGAFGFDRPAPRWGLAEVVAQAEAAGLRVLRSGEAFPKHRFADVGALVYYLRSAGPADDGVFQLDVDRDRTSLQRIHDAGGLVVTSHRLWFEAIRS